MNEKLQKAYEKDIKNKVRNVWKIVMEKDPAKQMGYAAKLIRELKKDTEAAYKSIDICEDMIDKLTTAGKTFQEMNEWIDLLYIAMGQDKDKIIHTALLELKAIENYKKRMKRENYDDEPLHERLCDL